ncbi:MAG: helix-turn-helix transcriptional regulator [Dehalococcoidia bacterium]
MEARRGRPPYAGVVTPAEERVLELIRTGLTNAEIAIRLGLSINTVRYHVTNLVAKANAETRTELRSWQPDRARRTPLGWLGPVVPGLKGMVVASAVAGIGIAAVSVIAVLANREGTPEPALAPAAVETPLPDPPRMGTNRVPHVPTFAVVVYETPDKAVLLLDSQTGAEMARAATGYNPMVTFRRTRDELLVSYMTDTESGVTHVLDVLDTANGLVLKRRLPVPDRPNFHGYVATAQALSGDESFFAIATTTMRTELPECRGGGDGPSCARDGIRIVQLDAAEPVEWWFELPRHCGGRIILPFGADGFTVTCVTGEMHTFRYDALAGTGVAPSARFQTDPVTNRNRAGAILSASADNGWSGSLMSQGSFVWTRPGEAEINRAAIPTGKQPRWPIFAEIGGGRLVVGYITRYYDQYPEGLAVFNMVDGTIERELPGFDIGRSMVASGPNTLVAVTTKGRLIEIDVDAGTSRDLGPAPTDPENVALVR